MQPESLSQNSMNTLSNQSLNLPQQAPSVPQKLSEYEQRIKFLKKLQSEGYVTLKVNFQYMENDKTKFLAKKIKASQNEKLLHIFIQIRKIFKELLFQRGTPLKPEEGVFLFINSQRILEFRSTIKEMENFMKNDKNGKYLEITATTMENMG